jgi:hypothetical protein
MSRRLHGVLLALSFFVLTAGSSAYAQAIHGVMRVVKGEVTVLQASDGKEIKAKIGQKVFPKDTITAGKDSRAKVVMVDNNEINISPDSKIQIQSYEYKPTEDKKNVLIDVMYGKVRAKVNQKYEGDNKFQVKTPSAVAGVRGTDFITSFDSGSKATKIVTFEGRVAFGQPGAGGQIINPVFVSVGQSSSMAGNKPPTPPVAVPKSELADMDHQSDANKSDGPKDKDSRQPADANKDEKKKEEKKDGEKHEGGDKAKADGPAAGEPKREVASTPPATAPTPDGGLPPPVLSGPNVGPTEPPPKPPEIPNTGCVGCQIIKPPMPTAPPPNPFVNDVVSGGTKKLSVTVTPGNK